MIGTGVVSESSVKVEVVGLVSDKVETSVVVVGVGVVETVVVVVIVSVVVVVSVGAKVVVVGGVTVVVILSKNDIKIFFELCGCK